MPNNLVPAVILAGAIFGYIFTVWYLNRHKHSWVECERIVVKPVTNKASTAVVDTAKAFLFGTTTIILKCRLCGDRKSIEVFGNQQDHK